MAAQGFACRASPTGVGAAAAVAKQAEVVRRVGGASGPGGAALKTYRNLSQRVPQFPVASGTMSPGHSACASALCRIGPYPDHGDAYHAVSASRLSLPQVTVVMNLIVQLAALSEAVADIRQVQRSAVQAGIAHDAAGQMRMAASHRPHMAPYAPKQGRRQCAAGLAGTDFPGPLRVAPQPAPRQAPHGQPTRADSEGPKARPRRHHAVTSAPDASAAVSLQFSLDACSSMNEHRYI
jgi:hypothetical protein